MTNFLTGVFGDWRVEEQANYQGQPHLVGGYICCSAMMVAEIRGAIRIDDKPHELHVEIAHLLAAAPQLRDVVERGRQKLATYVSVFPGDKELRKLLDDWDAALAKAAGAA